MARSAAKAMHSGVGLGLPRRFCTITWAPGHPRLCIQISFPRAMDMLKCSFPRLFLPTRTMQPPGDMSFLILDCGEPTSGFDCRRLPLRGCDSACASRGTGAWNLVVREERCSRSCTSASRPWSTSPSIHADSRSAWASDNNSQAFSDSLSSSCTICDPRFSLRACVNKASASSLALTYFGFSVNSTSAPSFSQSCTVAVFTPGVKR
mmetsp:Transcript_1773/g.3952  ORF Transcript_1773/g.3952 Transcript_1773/m.3952 type:complete len:207 (+) Transcript_1773:472-1092(+)